MTIDSADPEYRVLESGLRASFIRARDERNAVRDAHGKRLFRVSDAAWKQLCESIEQFVRYAQAAGEYPEKVLIRVKDILSETHPGLERESPLREAVIRCCMAAYFAK